MKTENIESRCVIGPENILFVLKIDVRGPENILFVLKIDVS